MTSLSWVNVIVGTLILKSWDTSTATAFKATSLSASKVLSLCPSDSLVLTCTSNSSIFLQWRIMDAQGTVHIRRVSNDVTSYSALTIGTIEFRFSLNSQASTLPHISQIQAGRVANGTVISCSMDTSGDIQDTLNTTICIIGSGCGPQIVAPELSITEQPELYGVLITVEWIPGRNLSYNVSVFPEVPLDFILDTRVQLTIPYNTQITMNVSATLCEQEVVTARHFYHLNSSEEEKDSNVTSTTLESCDHALIMNNNITIINRTSMTLAFMCKEGFVSTNNTKEFVAMCTDNNSWSPDPTEYNYCVPQSSSTTEIVRIKMRSSGIIGGASGAILLGILMIAIGITVFFKRKNFSKTPGARVNEVHCDHEMSESQNPGVGALVYADIGSMQLKQQSLMTHTIGFDADEYNVEYAVLNHKLCKETSLQPVSSTTEAIDQLLDLDNLLLQVRREVTHLWYQFGEALGIKIEILNSYTECCHDQSIIEMLDYWLRNYEGQPSWKEVAVALKTIGLQRLGSDIEEVYKTGKFPTEMDPDECDFPQKLHKTPKIHDPLPTLPSKMNLDNAMSNMNDPDLPPPIPPKITIPSSLSTDFQLKPKYPVPARPPKP